MKRICVGILAHVDAGKTTCVESMLYNAGNIRKMGRVDHQDTFLDYDQQERDRGITIYSKEANYKWNDSEIYILDTPGHVDFSSEMERVLSVLDLAIVFYIVIDKREGGRGVICPPLFRGSGPCCFPHRPACTSTVGGSTTRGGAFREFRARAFACTPR